VNRINRRDFTAAALAAGGLLAAGLPTALAGPANIISRKIPSSGEPVPIMGLGTNRYGVGESAEARAPLRDALARFQALGGTVIDTAPSYRTSESVLGDLIGELGIRGDLFVATKVDRDGGRDDSLAQVAESAGKLRVETIDLMQVHSLQDWQNNIPLLHELKREGRIRYVGLTTSRSSQYEEMEKAVLRHELDFIQVDYSLEQRKADERLLPLAADRGIAVMLNRTFGGGRIFEAVGDQPLPAWAAELQITSWAQFLLKYALSHPAATVAIPGMTKTRHVDDNFGAAQGPMPDAGQRRKMEAFFDAL
jgi:aryl-alcohol dehydrogenase-like predicted oxidoreductase